MIGKHCARHWQDYRDGTVRSIYIESVVKDTALTRLDALSYPVLHRSGIVASEPVVALGTSPRFFAGDPVL